jgi:general secretion pathway protein D
VRPEHSSPTHKAFSGGLFRHRSARTGPPVVVKVLVAVLCLSVWMVPHAFAQIQIVPPPPAAVLTDVAVSETPKGETRIQFTFDPLAPKFSLIKNDSDKPSIAFAQSSRGLGAKFPTELHGVLSGMSIEQVESVLIVHFAATASVHLDATPTGDKIVTLVVAKTAPSQPTENAYAAAGPLPVQPDPKSGEDGFEVVPLKYADVSEVVGLLTDGQTIKSNDLFAPHEPAFGSAGMGSGGGFAQPGTPDSAPQGDPFAQSVNDAIGVDRRLNAIILKGSPERIARLKEKIAKIDVPVESVVLETMFVELDQTGARNVGVNFNNTNGQIGVATLTTGSFTPSGFVLDKALSSGSLQAAIYAQVQDGRGKIVSRPRIAALSGSTAKIITGDALPILTAITLSGVNGVSQQVQYVNVGVTLQIAPRVSDDGFVTSHIFCVVSSVTGTDAQGYPTISQREAQTSATVHDGETFVIGGLTEDDTSLSGSKVPILGDIPLVNSLFNLHQDSDTKTDLYIVVTPHVVKPGEPLPDAVTNAGQSIYDK